MGGFFVGLVLGRQDSGLAAKLGWHGDCARAGDQCGPLRACPAADLGHVVQVTLLFHAFAAVHGRCRLSVIRGALAWLRLMRGVCREVAGVIRCSAGVSKGLRGGTHSQCRWLRLRRFLRSTCNAGPAE